MLHRSDATGALSVLVKSASLGVGVPVKNPNLGIEVPVKSQSVCVSVSGEKLNDAIENDENVRPREEKCTSSDRMVLDYEDFLKWKNQQKIVEPYKQCVKEIASSGHVFSNVSNCQIVVLNSGSSSPNISKALELFKVWNAAE
jgi:hypothetical protein